MNCNVTRYIVVDSKRSRGSESHHHWRVYDRRKSAARHHAQREGNGSTIGVEGVDHQKTDLSSRNPNLSGLTSSSSHFRKDHPRYFGSRPQTGGASVKLGVDAIRERARGQWVTVIFPALGIGVPSNPKRHGPCPTCGGKDRFRCDDKDGRGTWFCSQCEPHSGDGFALVQRVRGCNFKETLHAVASILGLEPSYQPNRPRPVPRPKKVNRAALAFKLALGALDRRLRAEKILSAAKNIGMETLNGEDLDRAMVHVGGAYADLERAEVFERVSDTLRERDFIERTAHERTRAA